MPNILLDNYLVNYQVFFKNNKHIYMRIRNGELLITCHSKWSVKDIEQFIIKHRVWILEKINEKHFDLYNPKEMYLWGQSFPVIHEKKNDGKNVFVNGLFYISLPDKKHIEEVYHQAIFSEIQTILSEYQNELKRVFDLQSVVFKSQLMRSRLGSCQCQKKIIKINSLLARLDKTYLRLVLFHELTHLVHPNHSSSFHQMLESLYPNHRQAQAKLNRLVHQWMP